MQEQDASMLAATATVDPDFIAKLVEQQKALEKQIEAMKKFFLANHTEMQQPRGHMNVQQQIWHNTKIIVRCQKQMAEEVEMEELV